MRLNQIFQTGQSSLTFQNIYELKWVDFLTILKTQQHVMLDKGFSPSKKYSEKQMAESFTAFTQFQDEVFLAEDTPSARGLIKKSMERLTLIERVKLIQDDANLLVWYANQEEFFRMGNKLEDWDFGVQAIYSMIKSHDKRIGIQFFGAVKENLTILDRVLASLINEYNTKHKDIESKIEKKESSLDYDVHQVNIITGLGLKAKKMTCSEWIEAKKIAREMNKPTPKPSTDGI